MVAFGDKISGKEVTLRSEVDFFVEDKDSTDFVEDIVLSNGESPVAKVIMDGNAVGLSSLPLPTTDSLRGIWVNGAFVTGKLVFCLVVKYGFLEVFLSINKLTEPLSFGPLSVGLIFKVFEPKLVGSRGYSLVSGRDVGKKADGLIRVESSLGIFCSSFF